MNKKYFNITIESIGLFLLVSIAWIIGARELFSTLTNFTSQWYWFVLATVYTVTLSELFAHRICCHRHYLVDVNKPVFKVLVFLHAVDHGWGTLRSMCLMHLNHHMYSDQGKMDHLNPRHQWYGTALLSPFTFIYREPVIFPNLEKFYRKEGERFKEILDDEWVFFCEEFRVILTITYWGLLYLIAPIFLFKVVLMGRFLMSIFTAMGTIGGHTNFPFSYRNFNTRDNSHNSLIFHYFALGTNGTMLQNNHHGRPKSMNHAHRWFEIDTGYYIMKALRPFLEKKRLDK
jgi:stearoyl-CoA desaturase (delta-9 desaturase)